MIKKIHIRILKSITLLLVIILSSTAFSQTVSKDYIDGQIWFRLKSNQIIHKAVSIDGKEDINLSDMRLASMPYLRSVFTAHSVTRLIQPFSQAKGSEDLLHTYRIEFSDINNVEQFIKQLAASGAIEYAEKVPLNHTKLTPNDPFYNSSQMWGLFQINAGAAWNVSTGSASIVVAVTDNAVEIAHPDLTNQIWTNTGEIPNNGLDDDNNGYVDDVNGWDAGGASGTPDNDPSPPSSSFDHGTHVSGTIGAESNNNIGVASIGYGVSIMPVKSTRDNAGSTSVTNGYDGIYYATVNNADVINCSWGGTGFSTTGQNIVNFAWNNGSIVVAAAGNDGTDNDVTPHYPSGYSNAIAVASSTTGDVKSSFSNYGTNSVDITAPGSNIASTVPFGNYGYMSGTSMATPMVSGLLGLMKSLNPGMPNQDLINCLYSSADNIDGANPSYVGKLGNGRINALAAMNCVGATLNNPPVADFVANFTTINAGGTVAFTDLSTFSPTTWSWNFDNQGLGGVTPATANTQGPHNVTYSNPGVYEVSLTVTNANGNNTMTKTGYITVNAIGACVNLNLDDPTFGSLASIHVGWNPSVYTLSPATDGYVAGTNNTGDKAKAEYFPAAIVGSLQYVTGAYVWFGKAYAANGATTIDINVYDATGGTPGAILGTRTVAMSTISNGSIRYYQFNPAIAVPASSEIAVGVDFSNLNWSTDTLAIVTNAIGETSSTNGFEKLTSNTWQNYSVRFGGTTWSHYIFPEMTNTPAAISLGATPTTICEGDMVSYDATGSTVQDTLLWDFVGTTPNQSNNIAENIIYNTAGTYKTFLQVIGGGCSNYLIDSVTITVNPTPTPFITSTQDTVCNSASITLTCNPAASSYLWTPGGMTTQSRNSNITYTRTYGVSATTNGCTGFTSKTVYVISSPVASALSTPSSICVGDNVNFDGTNSTDASSYNWTFPAGSPSSGSSNSPLPIVSFGAGGSHSYSLQVTNTCGNNTFNGTVVVNALPTVVANAAPNTSICQGNQVTLTGGGANTYSWDNGVTDGAAFAPPATTTYTVTGTDANGCINTDQITVTVNLCTGIESIKAGELNIYPNPANNIINVVGLKDATQVSIIDVTGKMIYVNNKLNNSNLTIDVSSYSKGLYFMQIQIDNEMKSFKIVKQ